MTGPRRGDELSLTEWAVLAVLAEEPAHGFAIARELRAEADLGRIMTVHRPLVYRALGRLVDAGLAETLHTERGDAGPNRSVHRPTRRGRAALRRWMHEPVTHVRDLRIAFVLKLRLTERARRDPAALVEAQRRELAETLDRLAEAEPSDVVERWRHHSAVAARDFLDNLAR